MGNKVTVLTQITGSGGPGRQQYERNVDTGSSNCAPGGGTGKELARKEVEAQPLWPTRRSLKEVAGKAGCSLEAD